MFKGIQLSFHTLFDFASESTNNCTAWRGKKFVNFTTFFVEKDSCNFFKS